MDALLEKSYEELLKALSNKDYQGAEGAQTLITATNVKLTREIGDKLHTVGEVIGASANQIGRGAKLVSESVDQFRNDTQTNTDKLIQSLDLFRNSMDTGSRKMFWLTLALVLLTFVYTVATAFNVYVTLRQPNSSQTKIEYRDTKEGAVEVENSPMKIEPKRGN